MLKHVNQASNGSRWLVKSPMGLSKFLAFAIVALLVATSFVITANTVNAAGSENFIGYNSQQGKWTTGNLGGLYLEGDFVSYQLQITSASKVWGHDFGISYDFFQSSSGAVYVDGFDTSVTTGFQYTSTSALLPDGTSLPPSGWGTHIPTPAAGESWTSGPRITNYMSAFPNGTSDGSPAGSAPAANRYFNVTGLPWSTFTSGNMILFFRAHLALSIIWQHGLESILPQALDGNVFQSWTTAWNGSAFATGSSRHFALQYPGIGQKTIPIPIAVFPVSMISGFKYVAGVAFNGWQITLNGTIDLGSLPAITFNPPPVLTGLGKFASGAAWPTGYFEFIGLVNGTYTVTEENRSGFGHQNIVVGGGATNVVINVPAGTAFFALRGGTNATVDFYNRAGSTTTTQLSASTISLGQSVTDTVTVSGVGVKPTGTVQFLVKQGAGSFVPFSTKTLNSNGQATSDSYMPLSAGSYFFKASYSGDTNYQPSQSADGAEPLTVGPATPTVTTLLSASSITLGGTVTDMVTVTGLGGAFPMPTGTVTFQVSTNGGASWTSFSTKTLNSNGQATSDPYQPLTAGSYLFRALYSGDGNYSAAQSGNTAEPLSVGPATPTVTTLLSASTITLGGSVTDMVTVTGLGSPFPVPTGTVQFQVQVGIGPWTTFGATKTLVGGTATSDPYTPLAVGNYNFRAIYSGDSNYVGAQSGDSAEPLVVQKFTPTVTTQLSSTSITLGGSVTDTVTVTGLPSPFPMPTGTVQFQVSTDGGATWTLFSTQTLVNGQATSSSYTPLAAGSYLFRAIYAGDANYNGAQSGDRAEPLSVGPATPTVTTQLSQTSIVLGGSITDTVTVTGLGSPFPVPTGTVQFYVKIGAGAFTLFSTKTLDPSGHAVSDSYTPLVAGSYFFKAVYLGDGNYVGAQSGDTAEPLNVGPATPVVTTQLSQSTITLGASVTDTVTVTGLGPLFPVPTGTVQFYVMIGAGPWTLFSTKTLDASGQATSDPYTPLTVDAYHFKAVYLGDSNYVGAQSGETAEPLTVQPFSPTVTTQLSSSSITLGGSVTDTVTVTGLPAPFPKPTGTVEFQVSVDGGATWTLFSTQTLVNGQATSSSYTPLAAGTYLFRALYLGDTNYNPAQSADDAEPLIVGPATPQVTTQLSQTSITLGGSITDTVTVAGLGSPFPVPTGTVQFYVKLGAGAFTLFSTKTLDATGHAVSDSYTPVVAGTYFFKAIYLGDANYVGAQSGDADEPLTVGPATPTVTTQLSSSTVGLGGSVTDLATVTGLGSPFPVPTGTVQFYVMIGAGPFTLFSTKTLVNGQATSDPYTPLTVDVYHFKAVYLGDSNYVGAQSGATDEPLNVTQPVPTVVTQLSQSDIVLGASVTDKVTVTGLPSPFPVPTGMVQFYVKIGAGPFVLFSTKTLDANGQATSDPYTPLTAGSYNFQAVYLGDSNYLGAQSDPASEPLIVEKFTPTVTTQLSSSSITLGGSITDTVTVTGLPVPFPKPTGTVLFQVSSDGGATWTSFSTKTLDINGMATSDPYTPLAAGSYLFRAMYLGDTNYNPAQSADDSEPLSVGPATPAVTTELSQSTITLGGSVTDMVTVTGLGSPFPVPTGVVTFQVSNDGGLTWTTFSTKTLDSNGQAISDLYTPLAAGHYLFRAIYSGDSNYSPAQSANGAEPLTVGPALPSVTTLLSQSTITLGQSVMDTVTVTGLGPPFPVPTGAVQFYVQIGNGPFVLFSGKVLDSNGMATSDPYTPTVAGSYHFKAVYMGDSNYLGAAEGTVVESSPTSEPLQVELATPTVTTTLSTSTIVLGGSITDAVTVTGLGAPFPVPTGTVQFQVSSDGGVTWTLFSTKTLDISGMATSDPYTPLAAGSYLFRAMYSGDGNYNPAQSPDDAEPLQVGPATPSVTTLLSASSITLGGSVTDMVTVAGLGSPFPVPTGIVAFQVSTDGGATWTTFSTKTLDASGQATSDSYTPLAAGSYLFRAIYAGDSNYNSAQSGDHSEPLSVGPATPSVTTRLSQTTITLGSSVTDLVTVTGLGSPFPTPTGTVQFYVMVGVGPWTLFSTKTLDANGQATSDPYTPMSAGSYAFKAVYLGDSNYVGAQSGETAEPLAVEKFTPTVTTLLSQTTITLGGSVTDLVTVTGLPSPFPGPTGTVEFEVSHDGGATWTLFSTKTLGANGQATSDPYMPLAAGNYLFRALYLGDGNYSAAQSANDAEPLTVTVFTPTVTTLLSATSISLGGSVTDTATVTGLPSPFPVPTGTVQFQVSTNGGSTWTTFSTKTLDASGSAVSDPYTPAAGGTYLFRAVYSGDTNYGPAQSGNTAEPLTVTALQTRTVGYWKNHASKWVGINPNSKFPWTTGRAAGLTYIQILSLPPKGDATIILAYQYIAALLNANAFGAPQIVLDEIAHAQFLFSHGYPVGSNPLPSNPVRGEIITLAGELEAYNMSGDT